MNNLFNGNNNNEKGKKFLAFFTFPIGLFIISAILLIIAVGIAYPSYIEGKTANNNAQQSLKIFENNVLSAESFKDQKIIIDSEEETISEINDFSDVLDGSTAQISTIEEVDFNETQEFNPKSTEESDVEYTPIAKLHVEKIDLSISVLSDWSYPLLDISVNKFSGPEPNESGNFIVIGHNYSNGEHFGKLNLVEINDQIHLTDLSGRKITYEVYEILIIEPDETEKLKTIDTRTLTLITCDSNRDLRLVVKSRAVKK